MRPNLKSAVIASCLAVIALASITLQATQQRRNLDFTLVNRTGLTIMEVYLSPTSSDEWGEDVMGKDVLANREKVDIVFSSAETECNWDLKVVDEDDDSIEWTKLNLCTASEITLMYEGKKPTAIIK
ncbi:MAG: argininosuccinate lyase [Acidimicrobiia bacterium]|nr:argininosuccinate lyase [Acidimicrobiia bacterium]